MMTPSRNCGRRSRWKGASILPTKCWERHWTSKDRFLKPSLGHLYGRIGRKDEARKILEELRQTREQRYIEAYGLAIVYLGLGDRNETFNWLEQGYRDRDGYYMAVIRIDPVLASLHGDPRFEALAEKIVPAAE